MAYGLAAASSAQRSQAVADWLGMLCACYFSTSPQGMCATDTQVRRPRLSHPCTDQWLLMSYVGACCRDVVQHLRELVTSRTKLISLVHVSNTLGCVLDVEAVVSAARGVGACVLLDACQSVPHMPIDVQSLGVDWIVASGHKAVGPTGIGFLWGR